MRLLGHDNLRGETMTGSCLRCRDAQFDTTPVRGYNWHPQRHMGVVPVDGTVPRSAQSRREGGDSLSQVMVRDGETFDSLLRRFNKRVQMDGILSEARRRSHFEKPSVQRKRKAAAKRRKSIRSTNAASGIGRRR